MSPSHLLLLLSVGVLFQNAQSTEYVPVFMWGATTNTGNPAALKKIDAIQYNDILSEQLDSSPFTVVFIEETLSVEDFSAKDSKGRTAYPGLHEKISSESVLYLPFVASSLHTLNKLADADKVDRIHLSDEGLSADVIPGAGKFLYISLKDAREGEDRLHMLARHDAFMTSMFDKLLKKHDNVLAIYTARYPSWEISEEHSRSRRALLSRPEGEANPKTGFYNVDNKVLIYSSNMSLTKSDGEPISLVEGVATLSTNTSSGLTVSLVFGANTVEFIYTPDNKGYWWLEVSVNDDSAANKIYAPPSFSYHCSPRSVFSSDNFTLSLADFQTQPFFNEVPTNVRYNLAYDCVGFTSVPIWSGLFVVFLVIFITTLGITFMMDIRTMDRFDDPKGKTITINTSE